MSAVEKARSVSHELVKWLVKQEGFVRRRTGKSRVLCRKLYERRRWFDYSIDLEDYGSECFLSFTVSFFDEDLALFWDNETERTSRATASPAVSNSIGYMAGLGDQLRMKVAGWSNIDNRVTVAQSASSSALRFLEQFAGDRDALLRATICASFAGRLFITTEQRWRTRVAILAARGVPRSSLVEEVASYRNQLEGTVAQAVADSMVVKLTEQIDRYLKRHAVNDRELP